MPGNFPKPKFMLTGLDKNVSVFYNEKTTDETTKASEFAESFVSEI